MYRYRLSSSLLLLFMFCPCFQSPMRANSQESIQPDEYAIYSLLIDQFNGTKQSVIIRNTLRMNFEKVDTLKFVKREIRELSDQTLKDLKNKNRDTHSLDDRFSLRGSFVFVRREQIDQVFREGSWERYYQEFPDSGGYVSVSRVGFNKRMNEAIVYIEHRCGPLCATGKYVLLRKSGGIWEVKEEVVIWAS